VAVKGRIRGVSEAMTVLLLILIAISTSIIAYKVFVTTTYNASPKRSVLYYSVVEAKLASQYLFISLQLTCVGTNQITLGQATLYLNPTTSLPPQPVTTTDNNNVLNPGESKIAVILFQIPNNIQLATGNKVQLTITYYNPDLQSFSTAITIS
jgi:hypothetical protein